jgi:hypothetical protein
LAPSVDAVDANPERATLSGRSNLGAVLGSVSHMPTTGAIASPHSKPSSRVSP